MIYFVIYKMISKDTVTCQSVLKSGLLSATRYQSTLLKIHETFQGHLKKEGEGDL